MICSDIQYVMFDGWCNPLMQYDLSLTCLLASIQHAVTDGPFVSSNSFPVPVEHWHVFFFHFLSLSVWLSFSLCLTLSFSHFLFQPLPAFSLYRYLNPFPCNFNVICLCSIYLCCPFLCQYSICSASFLLPLLPCHVHVCQLITFPPSLFPPHPPLSSLFLSRPSSVSLLSWSQNYFKDAWNIFDCVTVLGSITDILVTELGVSSRIWKHLCVDVCAWEIWSEESKL